MNQHFAMDRDALRQLRSLSNIGKRPESIINALYAQAVLEYSIFSFRKGAIDQQIDLALERNNKKLFLQYTEELHDLIEEYKEGKLISEKGFSLLITFF